MAAGTVPIGHGAKRSDYDAERRRSLDTAIAQSRVNLGNTIEELHGRLNPAVFRDDVMQQFREAKESLKSEMKVEFLEAKRALREATIGKVETMIQSTQEKVSATGRSVVQIIKENPVPAALMGIGFLWMLASSSSSTTRARRIGARIVDDDRSPGTDGWTAGNGPVQNATGDLGHMASEAQRSVENAAHAVGTFATNVKTSVVGAGHNASDKIVKLAHSAQDTATHLAHDAADQGRKLGGRAEDVFMENPLAVGAAVLAAGVAVGLTLPMTQQEERWMGNASQQLRDKAEGFARGAIERAEDAVQQLEAGGVTATKETGSATANASPDTAAPTRDVAPPHTGIPTPLGGISLPRLGGAKDLDGHSDGHSHR
jgi:hypothetical protein